VWVSFGFDFRFFGKQALTKVPTADHYLLRHFDIVLGIPIRKVILKEKTVNHRSVFDLVCSRTDHPRLVNAC